MATKKDGTGDKSPVVDIKTKKPVQTARGKGNYKSEAQRLAAEAGRERRKANSDAARAAREAGEPTRWELYVAGKLSIEDADDEEIAKGRFKDRAGGFAGRAPKMTAKQYGEFRKELLRRGQRKLDSMYHKALKVLEDVAENGDEDKDRLKAAEMIMTRVAGKVPDRVEVGPVDAFSSVLEGIIDRSVKDAGEDA